MSTTRSLSIVAALVTAMAGSACGTRGMYTPFTEGSRIEKGKPEEARLSVAFTDANCLIHETQYDLTLTFKEGHRKSIRLAEIIDGEFEMPNRDTVQMTATRRAGMRVHSDDPLIEERVDRAVIRLKYAPEVLIKKLTQEVSHVYVVAISLFDSDNRVLGEFAQKITQSSQSGVLGTHATAPVQPRIADPTAPSSIFQWAASRVRPRR